MRYLSLGEFVKLNRLLSLTALITIVALTSVMKAEANCPYYGQPSIYSRSAGTEVRRWVTNTSTEWRRSTFGLEIFPGSGFERSQNVQVQQVHTQFWQAEVISQAAHAECEVVGYVNETVPGSCTSTGYPSQYPSQQQQQQQSCTPAQTVSKPVYGWKTYPEQSQIQNLPNQESVVSTRDFNVLVQVKGQDLQTFEKEVVFLSVDENGNASASWGNRYNRYTVEQNASGRNQTVVQINGQGRDLSSAQPTFQEMFRQAPQLMQDPNNPSRVYIKMEFSPEVFSTQGNLEQKIKVTYQAWQSSSRSKGDFRMLAQLATRSVYMTPNGRYLEMDVTGMGLDRNAQVKLFINFENSKWYQAATIELPTLSLAVKGNAPVGPQRRR
jgi:hypothetical protein